MADDHTCGQSTTGSSQRSSLNRTVQQINGAPNPFAGQLDELAYEANFGPTPIFNETMQNLSSIPQVYPNVLGCACNASYVSYGCCDAPNGQIHEDKVKCLGTLSNLSSNVTSESKGSNAAIKSSTQPSTSSDKTHHQCSGNCYSSSRSCSWQSEGDCKCTAPINDILFWKSGACVATDSNPIKAHGKRNSAPMRPRGVYRQIPDHLLLDRDDQRPLGICNESYVSYACADAKDGIVHEPLTNWLGALLPSGSTEYPPIPQEFLDLHGIKGTPYLGAVEGLTDW